MSKQPLASDHWDPLDANVSDLETIYEEAQHIDIIAALGARRYSRALEVGCSNGVLTRRLAEVADQLIAIDVSSQALAAARVHNHDQPHVHFLKQAFPSEAPDGPFDLIVLREVIGHLAKPALMRAAEAVLADLAPSGEVLLVQALGGTPDNPFTGEEAAENFILEIQPSLAKVLGARRPRYRLDLLRRLPDPLLIV